MKKTVLIIEDDHDIQEYYELLLSDFPIEILKAFNGSEALDIIDTGQKIDLIILDIVMPIMDGEVFLKKMQYERKLHIPVIVSTVEEESNMRISEFKSVKGTFFKLDSVDNFRTMVRDSLK